MRRIIFLSAMLLTAACGADSFDIMEPVAANATPSQTNAVVTVDGTQYEIGCPDFPCPVSSIVLDHIARRLWFWMPPGTFANPTIYLYVLRVPVQLHHITPPSILPPIVGPTQPPPPSLTGPASWTGKLIGPINQLTCGRFALNLNSPDNGPWDFVRGEVTYEYVTWNATSSTWVPTGATSVVPFSSTVWSQLLAGTFTLYPPFPNLDYNARFAVTLSRGSFTAEVNHTMLCSRTPPPPPVIAPPPPFLDGPVVELGTRSGPGTALMCSDVELTLTSPDNGPWSFVSGQRKIEFFSWETQKHLWYLNGNMSTAALSSGDWQALLNGTYDLSPGIPSGPYQATFTFLVERGQYQHTISHTMACGGHDFVDMQGS